MRRRNFLTLTGSAATGLLFSIDNALQAHPKPSFTMNNAFELKILATNWGYPGTLDEYCGRAKKGGI